VLQARSGRLHEIAGEVGEILTKGRASEPFIASSLQKRHEDLSGNIEACFASLHHEMQSILMRETRALPSEIAMRLKEHESAQMSKARELEAENDILVKLIERGHLLFSEARGL
jgi:hypothetical protein